MNIPEIKKADAHDALCRFFLGFGFPLLVCALNLFGYVTGLELYTNTVNMLTTSAAIVTTSSAIPLVPTFSTFLFQFSMQNSPESHVGSDYYHRPEVVAAVAASFAVALIAAIISVRKNGSLTKSSLRSLPMKAPLVLLSAAFLLNGAFDGGWEIEDAVYGALLAVSYVLIFWFFCLVFKGEGSDRIETVLIATAAGAALLLFAETVHLYLTNDLLFKDGAVVKDQVLYGWGMWTMAGQFLALTIPLSFLGVMRGKHPVLCFISATLALVGAIMTLSRNGLIMALLSYGASFVACAFIGRSRRVFRVLVPLAAITVALLLFIFREELSLLLSDYIDRGFSDNGRFRLWRHGIASFLDAPIFGKGFFGIQRSLPDGTPDGFSFYPRMMHSTPIQLLGSMGIFGFAAYAFYRYETLKPFVLRPTLTKTMLGATLLVVILASLIDNFLFLFKHMLFYPVVLAAAFELSDQENNQL